ncbi:MAG: glycosyltransferase [Ruminococcus sp.]|nr:glycosyltransferase [Ruminococcus sp.]
MHQQQNLVSVIIPVYCVPKEYIEICVKSFLVQTFSNIEIILVDDGTPDDGGEMCDALAERYENCISIHQENRGVSAARNKGLDNASGNWIMFADPDDYVEKNIVEMLLQNCDAETDIVCCCCKVLLDDKKENNSFFAGDRTYRTLVEKKELFMQLLQADYHQPQKAYTAIGVPWGKLYRKEFLERHHLRFDLDLRRMQDNLFNMYVFHAARWIRYIDRPLYIYRYAHLQGYQEDYNPRNLDINMYIIQKRKQCLEDTNLIQDSELYRAYLMEAFTKMKVIFRFGPLHMKYPESWNQQKKEASRIRTLPKIEMLMGELKRTSVLTEATDKVIYTLIDHKQWKLLQWLWSIKQHME